MFYYLRMVMETVSFFLNPSNRKQQLYEAIRKSFVEQLSDKVICEEYGINFNTFRSLKRDFNHLFKEGHDPAGLFFAPAKVGKRAKQAPELEERILSLREKNLSVPDIKAVLSQQGVRVSLWRIDKILKAHNYPVLPRRTKQSKRQIMLPDEFVPPESMPIDWPLTVNFESLHGSTFLFAPILKLLNIEELVRQSKYPETRQISALQAILSFVALKLFSSKRLAHSNDYGLDRGLGLFAGLNVLPKSAWFASYSYRVSREMNVNFL